MSETKKHVEIKLSQISETPFVRTAHTVVAKQGQTLEDLLQPNAWAHVATRIKQWDRIEVVSEDNTFMAELFVVAQSRLWLRVVPIFVVDLTETNDIPEDDEEYTVKWRGPLMKHCVVRTADDSNVLEKIASKEDALKAKVEYEKTLRR